MKLSRVCIVCAYLCMWIATIGAADPNDVVIIHGAWGGAHHWKAVGDELAREHGFTVRRVSLTGLGERSHLASPDIDLATHVQDVVNAIEFDDLQSIILVGHSYGGAVATGVADAIPDRIKRVIYIDSHLLEDGESYLTNHPQLAAKLAARAREAGDGWLIPVDWDNSVRDTPQPLRTLTDPIKLTDRSADNHESEFWLLTDGGKAEDDDRYRYLQRAAQRGWKTRVFPWNHNPHRSRPKEVVTELVRSMQ